MFSNELTLAAVDRDGAIRETAEEAFEDTRLGFLKKAGAGAAALAGSATVLGALSSDASAAGRPPAKFGAGDIGILNFALTLEYLEAAFYNQARRNLNSRLDSRTRAFLSLVVRDENAHVAFIRGKLGSKAIASPRFNFKSAVTDVNTFKRTASDLENTGVRAYLGQAGNLQSKTFLGYAGSIVTVEARHAAVINGIIGARITPNGPFDQTNQSAAQILAKASKFIVA